MDINTKISQAMSYSGINTAIRSRYLKGFALCLLLGSYTQETKAQNANFEWARNMGNNSFDQSLGVKADGNGNVYATGFFQGAAAFDAGTGATTLTSAGSSDAFLVKYGAGGNYLWVRGLGGGKNDQGQAIATDGKGNVYVIGRFSSADFVPGGSTTSFTAIGSNDMFLVKYDSSGNFLWANHIGGPRYTYANGITVDGNDNVYIVGNFSDSTDFDPGAGTATLKASGSGDIFLAKYDVDGKYTWAINMGSNDGSYGQGVAVDDGGNAYITGFFTGSVDFDPGTGTRLLTSIGSSDVYLAKYDVNGNYVWANSMGGGNDDYGFGVDLDHNGNVYIAGFYKNSADFNPGSGSAILTSVANSRDGFVAKYDSSGGFLWANSIGDAGSDESRDLSVDRNGNVYVAGVFSGSVDFDPGNSNATLASAGLGDAFLAKYDPNGNYLWAKRMGGTAFDQNWDVALDPSGNVFTSGHFLSAPADFNPGGTGGQLTPIGGSGADGFVVKFGCSDTSSSFLALSECGESYTFHGETHTASGTYLHVLSGIAGCDSTVVLELSLYKIEPNITINEFELGVAETYATYQWIKDGEDIPGATSATYTVTENGVYQVRVTNESGCEGISDVYPVTNVSIGELNSLGQQINIYPNPANDILYIHSPVPVNTSLCSIEGRNLTEVINAKTIDVSNLAQGIYLLRITDKSGRLIKVEKVWKQ